MVAADEAEQQPLAGWKEEIPPLLHQLLRGDSGIFQDESDYAQLSVSLHGLDTISEGIYTIFTNSYFKQKPVC